jgi:hypothetical protein
MCALSISGALAGISSAVRACTGISRSALRLEHSLVPRQLSLKSADAGTLTWARARPVLLPCGHWQSRHYWVAPPISQSLCDSSPGRAMLVLTMSTYAYACCTLAIVTTSYSMELLHIPTKKDRASTQARTFFVPSCMPSQRKRHKLAAVEAYLAGRTKTRAAENNLVDNIPNKTNRVGFLRFNCDILQGFRGIVTRAS